ncbi:hypothetical protein [Streptomyces polychromogenes]
MLGALGAARLNGTMQRRSQHEHWRRDGRRQAYAAFVEAAVDYSEAIGTVQANGGALGNHHGPEAEALCRRVDEMRPAVSKALALVLVEGPEEVAHAAHQAVRTMTAWACVAGVYPPQHPLAGSRSVRSVFRDGLTDVGELSDTAWERIREFETQARTALDHPLPVR